MLTRGGECSPARLLGLRLLWPDAWLASAGLGRVGSARRLRETPPPRVGRTFSRGGDIAQTGGRPLQQPAGNRRQLRLAFGDGRPALLDRGRRTFQSQVAA